MLVELRIRDLAVIEHAVVAFEPGLNVLTGETGAGKSILVDAILLVRGARAQGDVIRAEAAAATVEATLRLPPASAAVRVLEEAGLGLDDGQVVVRREVARSGRHRAFVNDAAVTVGLLARLGDELIQVHGQHEQQRLLEPARQLALLDRFAGVEPLVARVGELHAARGLAREAAERARAATRDRVQREDLLRFQVGELDAARLVPGEAEALRTERARVQHAGRLAAGLAEVADLLRDDADAALARLGRAARVLTDLARLDPGCAGPLEALEGARAHLEEAMLRVRALREGLVADPARLEAIDDRLDALARLGRKYGDTVEAMLAFRAGAAAELARLERHEEILAGAVRDLAAAETALLEAATELSRRRAAAAERLAAAVEREVRTLGLGRASFAVALGGGAAEDIGPRGLDRVEFRLGANPGEELRPLARVASGGELSRVMLALETAVAGAEPVGTLVFDEVDAGIGGRTADVVAEKLAAVARGRQVLCVTHLAPIAARADHHLRVSKTVRGTRTRATVAALEGVDRVDEIARMLAGERLSETARRHARELLALGRRP